MPDTLSFVPDQAIQLSKEYTTIISTFENGAEQRRQKRDNPNREWSLSYKLRTASEKNLFVAFFDSQKGNLKAFNWTNPEDNVQYLVRFKDGSLSVEQLKYDLYNYSVVLKEVVA